MWRFGLGRRNFDRWIHDGFLFGAVDAMWCPFFVCCVVLFSVAGFGAGFCLWMLFVGDRGGGRSLHFGAGRFGRYLWGHQGRRVGLRRAGVVTCFFLFARALLCFALLGFVPLLCTSGPPRLLLIGYVPIGLWRSTVTARCWSGGSWTTSTGSAGFAASNRWMIVPRRAVCCLCLWLFRWCAGASAELFSRGAGSRDPPPSVGWLAHAECFELSRV